MPQRGNLPLFDIECTVPSSSEQDVLQLFRNYNSTYGSMCRFGTRSTISCNDADFWTAAES